ncbi:hypothetical protein IMZ31_21665 (plasmid) [Pontibacillus sp. ALD_SL1]|uniref:hypothetical protein n=1 Tax=Pontibacillus sp. ALD_SL1 TaxID=2777185 RepID=UPI001A977360|nr:hypothetical protein [Pontibacillus sp. ALD_SL1]QST02061.1 hypothetical protein IMZ31_21665 [Pontibacillus sp. ALD_SL1]
MKKLILGTVLFIAVIGAFSESENLFHIALTVAIVVFLVRFTWSYQKKIVSDSNKVEKKIERAVVQGKKLQSAKLHQKKRPNLIVLKGGKE